MHTLFPHSSWYPFNFFPPHNLAKRGKAERTEKTDRQLVINVPACASAPGTGTTLLISGSQRERGTGESDYDSEKRQDTDGERERERVTYYVFIFVHKAALSGRKSGVRITRDLTSGHTRKMEREKRRKI